MKEIKKLKDKFWMFNFEDIDIPKVPNEVIHILDLTFHSMKMRISKYDDKYHIMTTFKINIDVEKTIVEYKKIVDGILETTIFEKLERLNLLKLYQRTKKLNRL